MKLKFQFLRFIVALESHPVPNFAGLKHALVSRFVKNWHKPTTAQTGQPTPSGGCDRSLIRRLSAELWSGFLELLAQCGAIEGTPIIYSVSQSTTEIVSSICYIVSQIPEADSFEWLPLEFQYLLSLTIDCLTFSELLMIENQIDNFAGLSFCQEG